MPSMTGFPPPSKGQVTLANWRTAPFNRVAFVLVPLLGLDGGKRTAADGAPA
jgi:hypothetical protein